MLMLNYCLLSDLRGKARPKPLHFPHHQGPSCRASTQCSSRTATISFYFDLRTAQSFSRFSSLAVNLANVFPKCNLHHAALKHTLHSRRCVDSLERSACAFFSLPLPTVVQSPTATSRLHAPPCIIVRPPVRSAWPASTKLMWVRFHGRSTTP